MTVETNAPLLRMVWPDEATEIDLEPLQGLWSVEQYLALTNQTNRLIEYTDGVIEALPMPTDRHQAILQIADCAQQAVEVDILALNEQLTRGLWG